MDELRKKQRQAFYDLDKNNAMEIRRRVERQAKIKDHLRSDEFDGPISNAVNQVNSELEMEAENLSQRLNDILEVKNYNLELRLRGAVASTGSTKDANVRILVINSDFVNAWNAYAKMLQKKGIDQPSREFLYKTLSKSEELINSCVYGYEIILESNQKEDTYIAKMYPQLFSAYALYAYVQDMFKNKNIKPVNERELNFFKTKLIQDLSKTQKSSLLKNTKSVLNPDVRTDYQNLVDAENEKYQELFKRNMSPNELFDFRLRHFGETNYDPSQEMETPSFKKEFSTISKKYPKQKEKDEVAYSEYLTEQQDKEQAKKEKIDEELEQLKLEYQAQRETQDEALANIQKEKLDKRAKQLQDEQKKILASKRDIVSQFEAKKKRIEDYMTQVREKVKQIDMEMKPPKEDMRKSKEILAKELNEHRIKVQRLTKERNSYVRTYKSLQQAYEDIEREENLAL